MLLTQRSVKKDMLPEPVGSDFLEKNATVNSASYYPSVEMMFAYSTTQVFLAGWLAGWLSNASL